MVTRALAEATEALHPVPFDWLGDRLSVLWTVFMASRTKVDPEALGMWLAEHLRLLGHLPHDIVALAIDRAVQTAPHGFIPSVGEICTIGDPMLAERRHLAERLALVAAARNQP